MRVDDGSDDLVAVAGHRRFRARQVIVATGAFSVPKVPAVASQLDTSIRQLHSSEYRKPSQLADGPVLVVGVGHSGADIAYETAATHRTFLSGASHGSRSACSTRGVPGSSCRSSGSSKTTSSRSGPRWVGGPRRDPVSCQLRSSESAGLSSTRLASYATRPASASARDGKPALDDGTVLDVGNVIWATGFQPDYAWIELPVAAADGWPIEDRGVSAEEGLYFVGIRSSSGSGRSSSTAQRRTRNTSSTGSPSRPGRLFRLAGPRQ